MRFATIGAVSLGMIVSGCAEKDSIFHDRAIKPGTVPHVITIDAKQRNVLFAPETALKSNDQQPPQGKTATDNPAETKWRMCAEASPDVFSAFAMSASGEASTDGKTSFGAKFGLSSAETAATIARSQSINIIRESMYRTCERYLSGAINKSVFITQSARDQRSMIAFLAIEQLTGVAKPPATIISGPGTSAALGAGAEAVKLVTDFRKSAIDAASAEAAAKIDFDKAKGNADCDKDLADDADDKTKTAYKACLDAKAKYAEKKAANEKAQTQLDQALKMGAATGALAEAKTETGQTTPGTGASPAAVSDSIAEAVVKIVANSTINESLMFCIGYLGDSNQEDQDLKDVCKKVFENSSRADAAAIAETYNFTPSFIEGVKNYDKYKEFQSNLIILLKQENDASAKRRMAAFESATKALNHTNCSTVKGCIDAVGIGSLKPDFSEDPQKFLNALEKWSTY